jgi:hypothetical protein
MKQGSGFIALTLAVGLLGGLLSPRAQAQTATSAMLTVGSSGQFFGFQAGSFGSLSQNLSADGHTITAIYDSSNCGPLICTGNSFLSVGGFSSDPGTTWLNSVAVAGGKTLAGANATYSYSGGVSTWHWSGTTATAGLGLAAGTVPSVTVLLGGGAEGTILPKYQVVGLTYAPPGAKSTAVYSNGFQSGTSSTNTSSVKTGVTVKEVVMGGFSLFGILNGEVSNTASAGWQQMDSSTNTVTIAQQYSTGLNVPGPASSGVGVDHDFDTVYVWLNPAVDLEIYPNGGGITFLGYNWDARDSITGMDVIPLTIGQLRGTQAITDPDAITRLNRTWDTSLGALTSADFLAIAASDPFYVTPGFNPNTDTSGRYELPNGSDLILNYVPVPAGGQATAQTYTSSYTTTSAAGKSAQTTYSVGYSFEGNASASFVVGVGGKFSVSSTYAYTNGYSSNITSGTSQGANFTIVPPLASDDYVGPTAIQVWKDNVYGTFMFFPEN